ncbi:MAG: carbon monoxide dehydrogenase, partial [Candidatus Rokubacteria bacterium]|nr:carbon monoxide dehydrogenase [Candidatus Rokubacteria bacterium]
DLEPPLRYHMAVEGKGGPGFVRGQASMELSDTDGGTRVSYSADVQVGGLIASVGQRMLGGVSKLMLDQFFSRMTELLAAQK